jgi:Prolyl-tRNA synthetase
MEKKFIKNFQNGFEVLFEDRELSPGEKFKDADLLGIPYKIILGKTYENEGLIEIKRRKDNSVFKLKKEDLREFLRKEIYDN